MNNFNCTKRQFNTKVHGQITLYRGIFRTLAPALHTARDTANMALAPSWNQKQNHQIYTNQLIKVINQKHSRAKHLLFAPTPLVNSSIKLLNHEVVNICLLSWILFVEEKKSKSITRSFSNGINCKSKMFNFTEIYYHDFTRDW
jgi:hypothetical protein